MTRIQTTSMWLAATVALGLASVPAQADVTYTFFDEVSPSTIDLEFTVAAQLSLTSSTESPIGSITGADASGFSGASPTYQQGPPGFQPVINLNVFPFSTELVFAGFPAGNPSNGAPGNGTFRISGDIINHTTGDDSSIGSATVSGIPVAAVPEPTALALLATGFLGLVVASRRWRRLTRVL